MKNTNGKIIIPSDVNVWPHEYQTALSLAKAGHVVEFIRKNARDNESTADVIISGVEWEMKAPRSGSIKSIERNLKRAKWQSENVILDSRRMKKVPDKAIERELRKYIVEIAGLKRILFVNRHGDIVDIN